MGLNKKELDKVVAFVKELPGNEEFIADLREVVNDGTHPTSNISAPKIDEIYEYCIEKVSRKQAEGIYENFPFKEHIPGLVEDYVRMESFRRKDKFEEFGFAVYQQIERITNAVFAELDGCTFLQDIATQPAYAQMEYRDGVGIYVLEKRKTAKEESKYKTIADFIVTKPLPAMDCVRMVLYFWVWSTASFDWAIMSSFYDIYNIRCMNHRGGFQTENQTNAINRILTNRYSYYLKFQNTLDFFISGIRRGAEENVLAKLKAWSESLKPQKRLVTITSILPAIFFGKDANGVSYESTCKSPAEKVVGDKITVTIEQINEKSKITKVLS